MNDTKSFHCQDPQYKFHTFENNLRLKKCISRTQNVNKKAVPITVSIGRVQQNRMTRRNQHEKCAFNDNLLNAKIFDFMLK